MVLGFCHSCDASKASNSLENLGDFESASEVIQSSLSFLKKRFPSLRPNRLHNNVLCSEDSDNYWNFV